MLQNPIEAKDRSKLFVERKTWTSLVQKSKLERLQCNVLKRNQSLSLIDKHPDVCQTQMSHNQNLVCIGPTVKNLKLAVKFMLSCLQNFKKKVYNYHRSTWGPVSPHHCGQTSYQNLLSKRLIAWNIHHASIIKRKYSKISFHGSISFSQVQTRLNRDVWPNFVFPLMRSRPRRTFWHSWVSISRITDRENFLHHELCQKFLGFVQANLYSRTVLNKIC